ncbi:sigma factor-like helix-turn-helix DNA-binding protein, partial [Clostridium sp. 2-1]|uniref:RNA polymerase sigma factor n=1 Tax=Clostridium sp. 2-1 TaxID=2070758 RepID=UPI0011AF26EF
KRAMLCFAAKKSAGTAQEQQTRLFRLALSCGREQRLRAAFGGRDPLTRELTFSAPEAERAFAAVGKINTTQRTVLYLYYNKDYSMAEIAALLRRSEGAVSRALQKAQAALK